MPEGLARNEEQQKLLDTKLPSNGGFLKLSEKGAKADLFGVSMFHQLHCLNHLRDAINAYQKNGSQSEQGAHAHGDQRVNYGGSLDDVEENILHDEQHLVHCLDYIAQVRTLQATSDPILACFSA